MEETAKGRPSVVVPDSVSLVVTGAPRRLPMVVGGRGVERCSAGVRRQKSVRKLLFLLLLEKERK